MGVYTRIRPFSEGPPAVVGAFQEVGSSNQTSRVQMRRKATVFFAFSCAESPSL